MFRFLLSAASIFVMLTATIVAPVAAAARRCEERMPVTLLSLYRQSEAIYVGKYERSVDGEPTEQTADYRVIPVTKHFTISSSMKGEPRKLLTMTDTEYRYNSTGTVEEESEHGEESVELKSGDPVLLFLKKNSETGEIEPTDYVDGIKKMTPDKLAAYEARIRDLKGILATEKPNYSHLVDWMIRASEDPLTRWEGTYELLRSFENLDWQEQQEKEAAEKPAEEKPAPVEGEAAEDPELEDQRPKAYDTGDVNYAKAVSEGHKAALTKILLNREQPKKAEGDEAEVEETVGDRELIELVKRWGDSRVAASLLESLRGTTGEPYENADLMSSIASMLHDESLDSIASGYSEIQWESDEDEIRDATTAAQPETPQTEGETGVAVENAEASPAAPGAVAEPAKEKAKGKTYGQLRAELMAKFLDRAGKVIAQEQERESAKLNH